MTLSDKMVTIRVPATTANIGPGFDSFGCALALYNTISVALEGDDLWIEGCDEAYCNEDNLVVVAYRAAMERMGLESEKALHITIDAQIPVCRGLGSSAALLVAGAMAASLLHEGRLSKNDLLEVCNTIEGHPDNIAPALYGGLTASMLEEGVPYTVRYDVHPSLKFVVIIPDFELSTHKARSVLPAQIPYKDAVYNLSHAAVLVRALELGDAPVICAALRDKLHQPYRSGLIAHYETARQAALERGALAYCISGAGPTQLALVNGNEEAFAFMLKEALMRTVPGWQVLPLAVDTQGAAVIA